MVSGLGVDQNHGLGWDDGAVPVDFCHRLSGQRHGADGVVAACFLDDGVQIGDFLVLKTVVPGLASVRVVALDVFVGSVLPQLTLGGRE